MKSEDDKAKHVFFKTKWICNVKKSITSNQRLLAHGETYLYLSNIWKFVLLGIHVLHHESDLLKQITESFSHTNQMSC